MKTGQISRGLSRRCAGFICCLLFLAPAPPLAQPAPQPSRIAFRLERGRPVLEWANTRTAAYRILASADLGQPDWRSLVTLTGDGPALRWSDERPGLGSMFYRVAATAEDSWAGGIQNALDTARLARNVPGAVAVVIHPRNGVWCGVSGFAERGTTNRMHPQMRFPAASITKTFTAARALQLIEQGKLRLDDPLSDWLPDFPNINNTITVRQLLDHTSGIFNINSPVTSPEYFNAVAEDPARPWTPEDLLAYAKPPAFSPGEDWQYSNTGYVVLGMVIAKAGGASLAEQLRARFFDPMKLSGTSFFWREPMEGDLAHGYFDFSYTGGGRSEDIASRGAPFIAYYTSRPGSTGVISTALDTARWIRALHGSKVISANSLKLMTNVVARSINGNFAYGMGAERLRTEKGDFYGHSGSAFGFTSYAMHSPKLDATIAVWINENRLDSYIHDILIALIQVL